MSESPGRPDLTVESAAEFYIQDRKTSDTDNSNYSVKKDLAPFVQWANKNNITLEDIDSWTIKQYKQFITTEKDWKRITIHNRMGCLSRFIDYYADGQTWEGHPPRVDVPKVDRRDEINKEKYDKKDALPQLAFLRGSTPHYATFGHASLETQWNTGRRGQAIVALDLQDYVRDPDDKDPADGPYLNFRHRPDEGTRLKNGIDSEEPVEISEKVAEVLDHYIARERWDKRDDYGRDPLFTTRQGRASMSKIRGANYLITQPCLRMRCPHEQEKESCKYRNRDHASKCPSSRSPHRIRTGSIQWQLDNGIPPEDVSDRVDASTGVIEKHYDVPDDRRKMEERRREYTSTLEDTISESGGTKNEDGS